MKITFNNLQFAARRWRNRYDESNPLPPLYDQAAYTV